MGKQKNVIVRFRTAMGGFRKRDVTEYLVKLHEEHKIALEAAERKAAALEQENLALRQAIDGNLLEELKTQNRELLEQVQALEAKTAELTASGDPELRSRELEAYRRAEAMERRASQRFRQVNQQVEEISGPIIRELAGTVDSARTALEAIGSQLSTLQAASEQLKGVMSEGSEKLEALANEPQ